MELNLAELGREGSVDLVKSATKSSEFFASLIGDEKLCHPFPVNVFRSFECHIHYFLSSSTHFSLPIFLSLWTAQKIFRVSRDRNVLSLVSEMLMPLLLFLTVVVVWQRLCYGLCCVCVCVLCYVWAGLSFVGLRFFWCLCQGLRIWVN